MHKPVILAVDDEKMNRQLMEAMIVSIGYTAVLASNGRECLEKISEVNPDVILLDVMMPEMNGFDVARRIKSNEATMLIPIVMVTALRNIDDRVKALEAGADDFLSKPVDLTELRARLKSLVKVKAYYDHIKSYQQALTEEVNRMTQQLLDALQAVKESSLETIYRLSRSALLKDEGTGSHINRVSLYAEALARKLELPDELIENILYATPMHDIGKIGIPDNILLKPGKLTPVEWEVMKTHTTIGAKILEGSKISYIKTAEIVALTHHEKWDGSGYPRGLRGEDIPLPGRITALVDVFDALVSERPYKKAFSMEEALRIIEDGKESHFDKAIVDAFMEIRSEILEIKSSNVDREDNSLIRYT